MQLLCATSNSDKFSFGKITLAEYDIELIQQPVEIDEIQGEEPEPVLRDKAMKAYASLRQPVVVTDDWWDIPALGGFPGPYMKSINHWFKPEDLLGLMHGKTDRRAILHYNLGYFDGVTFKLFRGDFSGNIIEESRGQYGACTMKVTTMDGDGGLTVSEIYDQGLEHAPHRLEPLSSAWQQLGDYLTKDTA